MYNMCRNLLFQIIVDNYDRIEKQAKLFNDQAEFGSWTNQFNQWKFSGLRKKGTANVEHGIIRAVHPNGNIDVRSY